MSRVLSHRRRRPGATKVASKSERRRGIVDQREVSEERDVERLVHEALPALGRRLTNDPSQTSLLQTVVDAARDLCGHLHRTPDAPVGGPAGSRR